MPPPLQQHQKEIQSNLAAWNRKPILREVYAGFYREIHKHLNPSLPGRIVEIGSGIGNLRSHFPNAICTDLFPNPWIDLTCDGYELPFRTRSVSHLLLIDVFHHLEAPAAFLQEAQRILIPNGRLILLDPFISWMSFPVYGLVHHEPIAWREPINPATNWPRPRTYYAAQGNATRVFFKTPTPNWLLNWRVRYQKAFASVSYILSGGFSGPCLAPQACQTLLTRLDRILSRWPGLFGIRCLVCLEYTPPTCGTTASDSAATTPSHRE